VTLRIAVIPASSGISVLVNPERQVRLEKPDSSVMPGLFAPWPDSRTRGFAEIETACDTLRTLLIELSQTYRKAGVYFEPINPGTSEVDYDYDIVINGQNSSVLPGVLDARLKDGDRVTINIPLNWDG
jgi:hypothetical protein